MVLGVKLLDECLNTRDTTPPKGPWSGWFLRKHLWMSRMWPGSNGQKRLVLLRTLRVTTSSTPLHGDANPTPCHKNHPMPPHRYRAQTLERRWVAGRFGKTLRWRPNPASSISEQHKRKKHMLASLKLTASLHLKRWDPKKERNSLPTINFQGRTLGFRWRVSWGEGFIWPTWPVASNWSPIGWRWSADIYIRAICEDKGNCHPRIPKGEGLEISIYN